MVSKRVYPGVHRGAPGGMEPGPCGKCPHLSETVCIPHNPKKCLLKTSQIPYHPKFRTVKVRTLNRDVTFRVHKTTKTNTNTNTNTTKTNTTTNTNDEYEYNEYENGNEYEYNEYEPFFFPNSVYA